MMNTLHYSRPPYSPSSCLPSSAPSFPTSSAGLTVPFPSVPDQTRHHLGILLGHGVQRATILKPLNLSLVESLREFALPGFTILGVNSHGQWLAHCQLGAHDVDFVVRIDLIVICRVRESQREHALLLQVGFMLGISLAMSSR